MTADQRPAQQDPQWDPTLADPLYVGELDDAIAYYRHRASRLRRALVLMDLSLVVLLVALVLLAIDLLVKGMTA